MGRIVGTVSRSRGGGGTSFGVKKRKWDAGRRKKKKEGDGAERRGPRIPRRPWGRGPGRGMHK